jgi:nucleoside-triphosphatase THEP1
VTGWWLIPTAAVALAALCVPGPFAPAIALVAVVAVAVWQDPVALRSALRVGLVLAVLFAAGVSGGLVAVASGWERGVVSGGGLLVRFLLLWLVAQLVARSVSGDRVLRWSRKRGLGPVGDAVGLAVNLLPVLAARSRDVVRASRQRGLPWWRGWSEIPEVLLAHAARLGDDAGAAAALRGHEGLMDPDLAAGRSGVPVVVITGRPGAGKTRVAMAVVARLAADGIPVAGVVQPGVFVNGEKTGFAVRDVASGEEVPFATRVPRDSGEHGTGFRFEPAGIEFARRALANAGAAPVLVVDELGPVELRGGGHAGAVRQALAGEHVACAMLVVRRHLVPALLAFLSVRDALVVDVQGAADPVDRALSAVRSYLQTPVE